MAVNFNINLNSADIIELLKKIKLKKTDKKKENLQALKDLIVSFYEASAFADELSKEQIIMLDMYFPPELVIPSQSWSEFKRVNETSEILDVPIKLELFINELCNSFYLETLEPNDYKEVATWFGEIASDFKEQYDQLKS